MSGGPQVFLGLWSKFLRIAGLLRSWSTLARRSTSAKGRETSKTTLIYASGRATASTSCTTKTAHRRKYTSRLQSQLFNQCLRATTLLYWRTARPGLAKRTRWKVSSTMAKTRQEASCLEAWRKSFSLSKCSPTKTSRSWFERATSKFTTKSFQTY